MTTLGQILPFGAAQSRARTGRRRWTPWRTGLLVLSLAAVALTAWSVWSAQPSTYYASIALSMSKSWPNFFFGAVDPAGTVTLDKIPGSFWVPAMFVKVFGYSTWAVVLPNGLAAVGAVLLTAITVKRLMGPAAGILAGAVVATTPILVAVARSNQPETFFVLGLAAVAWAAVRALTQRSFGWLIVAGLLIAASFQTYMLEAWAVWPALAAAWLSIRGRFWTKLWRLAVAGVVSLAASLTWIIAVSLVPASSRPYIGSTLQNSAWEMVFGYNGLGRFGAATADTDAYRSFTPPFSGDPGVLRLFNQQLAGQIAWLLPTAVVAAVVLWMLRYARPVTVLVTVWLATFVVMFSVVAGMHQFYTAALAVPVALVVALAFGAARRSRRLWPQVALIATAAVTALGIGVSYGGYSIPVAIVQALAAVTAIWMLVARRASGDTSAAPQRRWSLVATAAATGVALLLTPLVWSVVTIAHPSSINPVAGGVSEMGGGGPGAIGRTFGGVTGGQGAGGQGASGQGASGQGAGGQGASGQGTSGQGAGRGVAGQAQDGAGRAAPGQAGSTPGGFAAAATSGEDTEIISYLEAHASGDRYLAATFGAQAAASLIVATDGGSFLPIGGFSGSDPVPTPADFQQLVAEGDLRYVLLTSDRGGFGAAGASTLASEIRAWVQANCTAPTDAPVTSLYECSAG